MTNTETKNASHVRAYLSALESGTVGAALAAFFADDVVQVELPNRLNPKGGTSDRETLLQRAEKGQKLLKSQRYAVRSLLASGTQVAVEAEWQGELAIPVGTLAAGDVMKAHLAMFFELREGLIVSLRNYDCFEPW